jgi:hypothetical protein
MNAMIWIIGIIVVLAAAGAAFYYLQRERSRHLRTHFGPEYDHAIAGFGHRRAAERALADRAHRVEKLAIHPLSPSRRAVLQDHWQAVQARFVDDPTTAIEAAHSLLATVMQEQGYPTAKFEEEVELLSVHHPRAVQHYRAAHQLAAARDRGDAGTEQLRQTMIHYRALFEDLLNLDKENRHEA